MEHTLSETLLKQIGVYFYIPDGPFDAVGHHYSAECLMSGLQAIGVPVFSNLPLPGVTVEPLGQLTSHVYVFVVTQQSAGDKYTKAITECPRPFKFVLSMADSVSSHLTPANVPSLMAHENRHWRVRGIREPWPFGLSHARIEAASRDGIPFSERAPKVLCNFTGSQNQTVRNVAELALVPLIPSLGLAVDMAKTDSAGHFQRLRTYTACMAYGGMFVEDPLRLEAKLQPWLHRFRTENVEMSTGVVIIRWDSWRWWESLAAGCLTLQLDLEKYGFELPVMPKPWVHYVPFDFGDLKGTVDQLAMRRGEWAEIAEAGRRWALEHYAPGPVARRFIATALRHYGPERLEHRS